MVMAALTALKSTNDDLGIITPVVVSCEELVRLTEWSCIQKRS